MEDLFTFIKKKRIPLFDQTGDSLDIDTCFRTKDAKAVFSKLLTKASSGFVFDNTKFLWNYFDFNGNITLKQALFNSAKTYAFLKEIPKPLPTWKPGYSIAVATESEQVFMKIRNQDIPSHLLQTADDVIELQSYDVVQAVECENLTYALEKLEQVIFINSIDDIYLEKYIVLLSSWLKIIEIFKRNMVLIEKDLQNRIRPVIDSLDHLSKLIVNHFKKINPDDAEIELIRINKILNEKMDKITVDGKSLMEILSGKSVPEEVRVAISSSISESNMPFDIFIPDLPIKLDLERLEEMIKQDSVSKFSNFGELIKKNSSELKKVPIYIEELSAMLLVMDFFSCKEISGNIFPKTSGKMNIIESYNLFLQKPTPISFNLDDKHQCSILTGANSGGKTTLIEHIIQLISLHNLGLPVKGEVELPLFTDVYYFAKNKGSMSKGAFETLLSQLSKIKPGRATLILADEIESVTEPGVAANVIRATCDFFIQKGCFLIMATHLGQEIVKNMPLKSRVDGIEAKGLDENFELIVEHSPVLGKLANSTPELIIERLAKTNKNDYFSFLDKTVKKS